MNVELPDGTIIEDIPEGTTRAQLAAKLKANGMHVPDEWMQGAQPESGGVGGDTGKLGLGEAALSIGSGTLGSAVGGIAGLIGAALPGEPGQGARVAQRVQQAMTYEPRTESGRNVTQAVSYPFVKLGELADYAGGKVSEGTGSPLLGTAANVAVNMAPALIGGAARPYVNKGVAASAAELKRNAIKNDTIQRAQAEGLVTYPDGLVGQGLMKAGGIRNVEQKASIQNAEKAADIGRREAGLGPDQPMSTANFAKAREDMSGPYKEVAAMSPNAAAALETLRQARYDAQKWHRFYRRSEDPRAEKRADRFDAIATQQERLIDSIAQGSKNPNLLQQLREARTNIAKNMDVERATNAATGEFDPQVIGRMYEANPNRFSGGLETIGRFANTNPKMTQPPIRTGTPKDPSGGIPMARGAASSMSLWKMLQPGVPHPGLGIRIADVATRNPYALGVAPALGLRPPEE